MNVDYKYKTQHIKGNTKEMKALQISPTDVWQSQEVKFKL